MRVVAGKYRGKNLASPKDDSVRPTTTRIKETLFNVLQGYVPEATALDLFAGSGALGIECISRGAKEVVFVDRSKDSVALVKQNLKGIEGKYSVHLSDFSAYLRSAQLQGKKFDIIFLDPPYASGLGEIALDIIINGNLLADDGVIVFEHSSDKDFKLGYTDYKARTKRMGTVTAEFISKKRVAMMTGSFDPVTVGHEEVLKQALSIYDTVIVACLVNPDKTYMFNPAQRLALAAAMCYKYDNAFAIFSEKDAVDVAREYCATELVRGVRDVKDEGYEAQMAAYNRERGYDTRFIVLEEFQDVSSTLVREELKRGDLSHIPAACVPILSSEGFKYLK